MIEYFDSQQLPGLLQTAGNFSIFTAGCRVTAGVVVGQNYGGCVGQNGGFKRFAWVYDALIK